MPALAARRCRVELAIEDGALSLEPAASGDLSFDVTTPWGETTVRAPAGLLAVLGLVDGKRDGRAIARALAGDGVPEERVLGALGALRRARIIRFLPVEVRRRARA